VWSSFLTLALSCTSYRIRDISNDDCRILDSFPHAIARSVGHHVAGDETKDSKKNVRPRSTDCLHSGCWTIQKRFGQRHLISRRYVTRARVQQNLRDQMGIQRKSDFQNPERLSDLLPSTRAGKNACKDTFSSHRARLNPTTQYQSDLPGGPD